MGPFFVPTILTATIQELVKVSLTAWENFKWFFKPQTLSQFQAYLHYLEVSCDWVEATYSKKVDRRDIEAAKAIIAQLMPSAR